MNLVIKILKDELGQWKRHRVNERHYYKGCEHEKEAIRSLKECNDHIDQITHAIKILKSAK